MKSVHDANMRLRQAIAAEVSAQGLLNREFAERMGVDASNASRLQKADDRDVPVGLIVRAEQALKLPPGTFFLRAGLVRLPETTEDAIRSDARLEPSYRIAVLDSLAGAIKGSADTRKRR